MNKMDKRAKIILIAAAAVIVGLSFLLMWRWTREPQKKIVVQHAKAAPKAAKKALPAIQKKFANPKVAIVMDDFGYNMKDLDILFSIGKPVTFSILPNLKYSKRVAELANSKGYEVILHLPLEANGSSVSTESDTIKTNMDEKQVLSMLDQEIADIPRLKGISNHQGSKATEDKTTMSMIIAELKKKNLYFFDSFCTSKSVCRDVAKELGVKYGRRDIFLDDVNTPESVEKELLSMRKTAFKKGSAIAVCHDRKNTIVVLKKMMPLLAEDGIDFVYLSDMVK